MLNEKPRSIAADHYRPSSLLEQMNQQLAAVVDQVRHRLVQVSVGVGSGAGTLWRADGLIVTNAHVVNAATGPARRAAPLTVTLPDGSTLPTQVVALDLGAGIYSQRRQRAEMVDVPHAGASVFIACVLFNLIPTVCDNAGKVCDKCVIMWLIRAALTAADPGRRGLFPAGQRMV